jgi:aminoglycoside phosphotransferase (APT) family kinase protein
MSLAAATGPVTNDNSFVVTSGTDVQVHEAAQLPVSLVQGSFGTLLEPALRAACEERLSAVTWFRADWQRGGALTGYATYRDEQGEHAAVVKLPVPPCERHWLVQLQGTEDVVPRVYAHGESVGGYDLAWVVMERLAHGPLGSAWEGGEFDLLAEAAGRFYAVASRFPLAGEPIRRDWEHIFHLSRESVHAQSLAEAQRWNTALKKAHRRMRRWVAAWEDREIEDWCHGDLHLGNAMTREAAPSGPAVLLDFAQTRPDHWVSDAVYFEHLYWARPARLGGRKLCKLIAQQRKKLGLKVDEQWAGLAEVKRALLAMSTPAMLKHDGDPQHVHAALGVLERAVG